MRALRGNEPARTWNFQVDDLAGVDAFAAKFGDRHVLVGVASRARFEGGRLTDCLELHALFADVDLRLHASEADARLRLDRFPLTPSAIVATGGGFHVYWFLREPFDLQNRDAAASAGGLLRALATALDADLTAAEPARILRLPGTLNYKYTPPRSVMLEALSEERRYTVDDFVAVLGPIPDAEPVAPPEPIDHHLDRDTRMRLARTWLGQQVPAVEGRHGDEHTFQVCCSVAVGHDLNEEDAFEVLRNWNARCEPPWPDHELRRKIQNAVRYAKGTRGERLTEDTYPLTEAGDAEFFAQCHGDIVRYDHRRGRSLLFEEHHWVPDRDGEIYRLALDTIRARQAAALRVTDDDARRQQRLRWAIGGEARKRQENLLALARNLKPIADAGDRWDSDPWLLGVLNGVVDLRTCMLRAGRPDDRISMRVRASFDPQATSPLWDQTLDEIFADDRDLIDYFDRYVGYSLTGDCREETLAFCWGGGANGKGTVMNTIGWLLGDYADDLPFSALELHERSGIPNDIAKIVGKRFVTSSESGETRRLNEARVKALTGRDPITARFLHQEFFTFQPVAKFWLATNQKPIVRDTSIGFWRRIHLIPFTQSFADRPDLRLKDKLRAEAAGILTRCVRGCLAWQREGLNPPAVVREATKAYRVDSMPLTRFLDARCVIRADAKATFGELFDAYVRWCSDVREQSRLTRREFGDALRERFNTDLFEKRNVTFTGVGLIEVWKRNESDG